MVRLTFNPFKLRTVAHYAYEYVTIHGDVVRGKFTHTKPEDAFRRGYREAELKGRFPLQVRVVDERGEIVRPPNTLTPDELKALSRKQEPMLIFTQEQLITALKEAQVAHHKHEREELEKLDEFLDIHERQRKAIQLASEWVEWYVAHIFKRKVADSAIEEIVGTL